MPRSKLFLLPLVMHAFGPRLEPRLELKPRCSAGAKLAPASMLFLLERARGQPTFLQSALAGSTGHVIAASSSKHKQRGTIS